MHFGNGSIDFFLLTGARRKRMWALALIEESISVTVQMSVMGIAAKDWQHCVSSESCGGSNRNSLMLGADAATCANCCLTLAAAR